MTKRRKAFFITATGTDIGKTYVTERLTRQWRDLGCDVLALKPVVSGFNATQLTVGDSAQLLAAMERPLGITEIEAISPWRFTAPLSPDMAAAEEGRRVDVPSLIDFCQRYVSVAGGPLLIEGVGGVMVPLVDRLTVLDWIEALALPIILVTGSYLGTLSHTLTSIEALKQRGLRLAAIVVNESTDQAVSIEETVKSLQRYCAATPIQVFSRPATVAQVTELCRLLDMDDT
jgi:dethiobiotin synthetase